LCNIERIIYVVKFVSCVGVINFRIAIVTRLIFFFVFVLFSIHFAANSMGSIPIETDSTLSSETDASDVLGRSVDDDDDDDDELTEIPNAGNPSSASAEASCALMPAKANPLRNVSIEIKNGNTLGVDLTILENKPTDIGYLEINALNAQLDHDGVRRIINAVVELPKFRLVSFRLYLIGNHLNRKTKRALSKLSATLKRIGIAVRICY
jgi:hypothetical protein